IVGIADRAYRDDGTLVPRSEPGAVIHEEKAIAERTIRMVTEGVVRSVGGRDVHVDCDTVLLHGDTPGAVSLAHRVRGDLLAAGRDGMNGIVATDDWLLVEFDFVDTDHATVRRVLRHEADRLGAGAVRPSRTRRFVVPVVYGGEFGPDLPVVAEQLGVSEREV